MTKMGPENNLLRSWDILGCQVQNDLKNAREPIFGARSELFEKMSNKDPEKNVYASGRFLDVRCSMT